MGRQQIAQYLITRGVPIGQMNLLFFSRFKLYRYDANTTEFCNICFQEGKVMKLPCQHTFHPICLSLFAQRCSLCGKESDDLITLKDIIVSKLHMLFKKP
jgi:nitrate/TMAO reductase-like tetraheme cytochrome c subunit